MNSKTRGRPVRTRYHAPLNYGDPSGTAYLGVTPAPTIDEEDVTGELGPSAWRAFEARLATVNVADAVAISATNDKGLLRLNGRGDKAAIKRSNDR